MKNRKIFITLCTSIILTIGLHADEWRFGIMGDTQWDPTEVIDEITRQFIMADVSFVIHVGDLDDTPPTLEKLARRRGTFFRLYENNIPFYPVRGNHESTADGSGAVNFHSVYPDLPGNPGAIGSSPDLPGAQGLTYEFTHDNAQFIFLDNWVMKTGEKVVTYTISDYIPWITEVLEDSNHEHFFFITHANLHGQNHKDNLFRKPRDVRANPNEFFPEIQNEFYALMNKYNLGLCFSGHDHIHYRSLAMSPDGKHSIRGLICQSAGLKFYWPKAPFSPQDIPLEQECGSVGYYICTVSGSEVTVTYHSIALDVLYKNHAENISDPWPVRSVFGYNNNGKERLIARGESYGGITHTMEADEKFKGTRVHFVDGSNDSTMDTYDGRPASSLLSLGWRSSEQVENAAGDILVVRGLENNTGDTVTDLYVIEMDFANETPSAHVEIKSLANGSWMPVNIYCDNDKAEFVYGSYDKERHFEAGTTGYDRNTGKAWAVLNRTGIFCAIEGIP